MKYKILDILKNRNEYTSGEELGKLLNISRTAVWKNISKLKEEGYNILSVTNKGYLLKNDNDILNEFEINKLLDTEIFGRKCYYFNEVTSTNDEAKLKALNGACEGSIVITEKQTSGKGRLGRNWFSSEKAGIFMSMILRPDIIPMQAQQITLITGISVSSALENLTNLDVKIKWPNDVVINGKKVCGILTEMSAEMEIIKFIITGIGINVNNDYFSEEIKNKATSILLETGKRFDRKNIIAEVLKEFEKNYFLYCKNGFNQFLSEYKNKCLNLGHQVKLINKENITFGIAKDISENGELIVEDEEGNLKTVFSGEVSVKMKDDKYI